MIIDLNGSIFTRGAKPRPTNVSTRWLQAANLLRVLEFLADGDCRENFETRRLLLMVSLEVLYLSDVFQHFLYIILIRKLKLETISCEFWRICALGNALMLLETILCHFGRICRIGNALLLLEMILCKHGRICATGNLEYFLKSVTNPLFDQTLFIASNYSWDVALSLLLLDYGQIWPW